MIGTVLIVDDININRVVLSRLIISKLPSIKIITACSAFEAENILKKSQVDLIILDIMMPEKDGLQFLEELKESQNYSEIPVIMCSALEEGEYLRRALEIGAVDYFTKPLKEDEINISLPLKIKNYINYYKQGREIRQFYDKINEDLRIANSIQKSLVSEYDDCKRANMWGKYIPCQEIGGDMYCFSDSKDTVWFMIADIVGHGVSAALVSITIKYLFMNALGESVSPKEVTNIINKEMCTTFQDVLGIYASAFIGKISNGKITYVNAGHPSPIFLRQESETNLFVDGSGFLLGINENAKYAENEFSIQKGDKILLFTDGLYEKEGSHGYSDLELVLDIVNSSMEFKNNPKKLIDVLITKFDGIKGITATDDIAVMLIEYKG